MFKYCKKCVGMRQFDYTLDGVRALADHGYMPKKQCDVCGEYE